MSNYDVTFYKGLFSELDFKNDLTTFRTRAKLMNEGTPTSIDLENPIIRRGIMPYLKLGLNPVQALNLRDKFTVGDNVYPTLELISDTVGLGDCQNVIMSQEPGMYNLVHIDEFGSYGYDVSGLVRVMIFLTPWRMCQFVQWGDHLLSTWTPGDMIYYDWKTVPHGTANASEDPRVMLRLTGKVTDKFNNFIKNNS